MSKILSEDYMQTSFEGCEFVIKYRYSLSKGKFKDYKDADTARLFNGFKAAFTLLMPIINKQMEALEFYANNVVNVWDCKGEITLEENNEKALEALEEIKQMLEKQLEEANG